MYFGVPPPKGAPKKEMPTLESFVEHQGEVNIKVGSTTGNGFQLPGAY